MVLNLFRNGNNKLFIEKVDMLVATNLEDIDRLTKNEIIANSIDIADTASYATMLIPGVGIAMQLSKTLGKATIKGVMKRSIHHIKTTNYKDLGKQTIKLLEKDVKYLNNERKNRYLNFTISRTDEILTGIIGIGFIYSYFYSEDEEKPLCQIIQK
jgi:hypothetical protein